MSKVASLPDVDQNGGRNGYVTVNGMGKRGMVATWIVREVRWGTADSRAQTDEAGDHESDSDQSAMG